MFKKLIRKLAHKFGYIKVYEKDGIIIFDGEGYWLDVNVKEDCSHLINKNIGLHNFLFNYKVKNETDKV